jgi:D-alanyl-D-alanine carboxypeptidase
MIERATAEASPRHRATFVPAMRRRLRLSFLALVGLMFVVSGHAAHAKYAAFVMDADTGQTLFSDHADDQNYPASLTKMMTLYLLFEDMETGKVNLRTPLKVTPLAERQQPSSLGLRKGETISVQTAIQAIVIKSANDVAVTIAENLAPNEAAFAQRMTKKAQLLGMSHTVYRNASGLPNRGQVTTARDLARLALALQRDFPKYYKYFSLTEFEYEGQVIPTHNNLVKTYPGADGLKTGFIAASGFNLAASAHRNGRRLIAVVMGGETSRWRDQRTADLLDRGFADVAYASAKTPRPTRTPKTGVAVAAAPYADDPTTAQGDADGSTDIVPEISTAFDSPTVAAIAGAAPLPPPRKPSPPQTLTTVAALPRSAVPAHKPAPAGAWAIQVGAYSDRRAAETAASSAMAVQTADAAASASTRIEAFTANTRTLYRARVVGLSANDAQQACASLKRESRPCMVLRP